MFSPDILMFRQFYASQLGDAMCRIITASILKIWPALKEDSILGIGYASPYLEPYLEQTDHAMVCMPAQQGAAYWPAGGANRVFLSHESVLPIVENSVNRVLMVHSVENSEQLSWMMEEVWRVLTPCGRLLIVVPNRMGLWSHFSNNPLGTGRPFSKAQMKALMSGHNFTLLRCYSALFMPPANNPTICRFAEWFEKTGCFLYPILGGVWMMEAEKQVYASIRQPSLLRKGYHSPVRASKPALGLKNTGK